MKTWHYEIIFFAVVLFITDYFFANNLVNWVTMCAILMTFNCAQIGDRLQEGQRKMVLPTIDCFHKMNKLFSAKEILWMLAFVLMKNYAAIIGSVLFFVYPFWRKFYRSKIKPL